MSDALQRLIEAVEAEDKDFLYTDAWTETWEIFAPTTDEERSNGTTPDQVGWKAFNGDLNAAKALHIALLPGWNYLVSKNDGEVWHDGIYHESIVAHVDGNPARAWLLSILRAYQQVQA